MGARFRSWWQQIKQHQVTIGVIAIVLVAVIALIIAGYWFDWTGFNGYNKVTIVHTISGTNAGTVTKTEEYQPGKGLWDWLQLLIVPVALALIALLFNRATTRTEQKIAADRYKQDKEIASRHYHQDQQIAKQRYEQDQKLTLDKQREDLLHIYLDRMSELLLDKQLRTSEPDAEVRNVARVRTITILFQLDTRRIGYVLSFLREAGLLSNKQNDRIVSFSNADLSNINLSGVDLRGIDLSETKLIDANLAGADLSGVIMFNTKLTGANLKEAELSYADLTSADLEKSNLFGAVLYQSSLVGANLKDAILTNASLEETDLLEAFLDRANLYGAFAPECEWEAAYSLQGATMPDGSIHP
jgi:uncharacterized protein YjbI with pentapeptide repeats